MDSLERDALRSLRLSWAPTADDLWHSQGAFHVPGFNDRALEQVMDAFADAGREKDSSPLGMVVRGPAGSGKTHLLGQVRERVQSNGFFFLVELLDATSFWESARSGILESLGRPAKQRETQLKELLWHLSTRAHVTRTERRAIVGDDELTPEILSTFVNALHKACGEPVRQTHHTLRALVLLGANDFGVQDIGQAYLNSTEDIDDTGRRTWTIGVSTLSPQECVRDISRLVALAGPAVLAIDQIDTLIAQSADRTTATGSSSDNRDIEHVAHGLMAIRQSMRRTTAVVACLPAAWEAIRMRATAPVADRFREATMLQGLPSPDIARAILERRFTASYRAIEFDPPYPSWPILPGAFEDAPDFTPRLLLKRADAHVRSCLDRDVVEELAHLPPDDPQRIPHKPVVRPRDNTDLDRRFEGYRQRAVTSAVLDPDGEDTTVPSLLSAGFEAWIAEHGETEQAYRFDPPPGKRVLLHGRLRESLDAASDDERHWGFRAIASANATAAQNRIRNACNATGFGSNLDRRKLFLLRNTPWPNGVKTAAMVADFEAAGGRTLSLSDDDLRTLAALRGLIDDNHPDLPDWLVARKPAHGLTFLRDALGDDAGPPPPAVPKPPAAEVPKPPAPQVEPTRKPPSAPVPPPPHQHENHREHERHREDSATAIPLGIDDNSGRLLDVELLALRKHTAIFAGSGSGKTVLIRRLIEECALRGVSSIVLDPNNDLARLGLPWPTPPPGWDSADGPLADNYLGNTEVVVWTPRRAGGRPLSFQPLPDFASVVDDTDEYGEAVESAFAALEPRALIAGNTARAHYSRAVLRETLQWYGRRSSTSLDGFIEVLADLPDGISEISGADDLAAALAQNLRAAKVNDPMFGGDGTPAEPGVLLNPSDGYRARVSVISLIGLPSDEQRAGFVNQLQMALFSWIKRNPTGDRPLGGLLVMDEAQNFAPSGRTTAATQSTLALSSQARKYGLGLVFATQAPRGLHNHIPGNAATQFFGLLNAPAQITVANEMARVKGGRVPDISRLRAGNFYAALEGSAFHKITSPWCLSYHPHSPLTTEEVLELAHRPLGPKP
jgi:adenylylsulfate kinase-like enzyme